MAEAAKLNSAGMLALRAEDFAEAERLFVEAVKLDSKASALWRNVATARRSLHDDAGEMQALDAAIDVDRRDFMGWLRKAELHQRLGHKGDALAAWSGVLQLATHADDLPPVIMAALDGGREFVAHATASVAKAADAQLDAHRTQARLCQSMRWSFLPVSSCR
jgi:tetratricopeptide (TPR) repeat protein